MREAGEGAAYFLSQQKNWAKIGFVHPPKETFKILFLIYV
jgi:hypothetical protein